jgi:MFS family permease
MADVQQTHGAPALAGSGFLLRTPWHYGWNVIAVSLLVQTVLNMGGLVTFAFLIGPWSQDFHVAASRMVLGGTLMSTGLVLAGPFLGRLVDSASLRVLISAGIALFAAAFVLGSVATTSWHILALYALPIPVALGASCTLPAQVLAARWFPERRGLAIGIVNLGFPFPAVIGPPLVVALIAGIGWRDMFQIFALAAAVLIPLTLFVVRNGPAQPANASAAAPGAGAAPASAPAAFTVRQILSSRSFWILVAAGSLLLAAFGGVFINLVVFAGERGIDPKLIAGIVSAGGLMGFLTPPLWGHIADKIPHRYLFAGTGLAGAVTAAGLAFAHGPVAITAAVLLYGLALSGMLPLMGISLAYQFGPASLGRATGLGSIGIFLGSFGAPLTAKLHEVWGDFTPAILVMAGVCLLAGIAGWFLRYPRAA